MRSIHIIAETAFSHERDLEYLKKQIELISQLDVRFVKFQILLNVDSAYVNDNPLYDIFRNNLFSKEQWLEVFSFCKQNGLEVVVLPIDTDALDFVTSVSKAIYAIEIHSICLNDSFFLSKINSSLFDGLIILGVGGHSLDEIQYCIDNLDSDNLLLMYGHQNFPTKIEDNNISKISSLKVAFDYPIGFADHTPFDQDDSHLITMALTMGAEIIEKHFVVEKGTERLDYISAADQDGLRNLHTTVQNFTAMWGCPDLRKLSVKELIYKHRQRKIVAKTLIPKDSVFSEKNLTYKVTSQISSFEPKDIDVIIGKIASVDIEENHIITLNHFK